MSSKTIDEAPYCRSLRDQYIQINKNSMKTLNIKGKEKENVEKEIKMLENNTHPTIQTCLDQYYNDATCKNTIFEVGDNDKKIIHDFVERRRKTRTSERKLTPAEEKKLKKALNGLYLEIRKYGKIKNGFHSGITRKNRKTMKKYGITSGCVQSFNEDIIKPFNVMMKSVKKMAISKKKKEILAAMKKKQTVKKQTK